MAAHGEIENESAQAHNRIGRVGDAFVVGEKAFHRAKRLGEDRLQLIAQGRRLGLRGVQTFEQQLRVAMASAIVCGFLISRL